MRKLRKVAAVLRNEYRSSSLLEFVGLLKRALFQDERILIYARSLDDREAAHDGESNVGVVKGVPADLHSAREHLDRVPWEFQCDLYDGVQDFFIYRQNGTIGHISWLYYPSDPNRILRLGDRHCEIKFCLTFPEFRGKGLYPAALRLARRYLKDQGYERCFICVKDENTPSIRGIEKAGFRFVGEVRVRKAFGFQISCRRRTDRFTLTA